jgi:hypothetical protein
MGFAESLGHHTYPVLLRPRIGDHIAHSDSRFQESENFPGVDIFQVLTNPFPISSIVSLP